MSVLVKAGVGVAFVVAASQLGHFAQQIVERARTSVQASELLKIDGHLAAWTIDRKNRTPRDQAAFERALKDLFTERAGRRVTEDRWGKRYQYSLRRARPPSWRIASSGADRQSGTADDLVVERRADHVEINQDPTEVAEAAIAWVQRQRRRELDRLRRVADQAAKRAPVDTEAVEAKAVPKPERAQRALLEASRPELDALLRG